MSPSEPKLKRSPYLSQMTRTSDTDATSAATLASSWGIAVNSVNVAAEETVVALDLFELKRPEMAEPSSGRQQQLRPSLKNFNSTEMKKATSVTFSAKHASRSTAVSAEFLNGTSSNADFLAQQHQLQMQHPPAPSKLCLPNTTTPNLQYHYNPAMKCSAMSLDLNNNETNFIPSRTMTFRDVLDEGDGKMGDLNLRLRNEQWKTFAEASLVEEDAVSTAFSESRKKREHPLPCSMGGWVSADDLAVLRRAASRLKMSTNLYEFVLLSKAKSSMRNTPVVTSEEFLVHSLILRDFTSAGLAYGSDNFRILNGCKSFEIIGQ